MARWFRTPVVTYQFASTPDLVDIADVHSYVSSDGAEGPPCLVSWAVHSFVEVYSIADVHAKEAVPFYVSSTSIYVFIHPCRYR